MYVCMYNTYIYLYIYPHTHTHTHTPHARPRALYWCNFTEQQAANGSYHGL